MKLTKSLVALASLSLVLGSGARADEPAGEPVAAQSSGGITVDEYLQNFPPPPYDVTVRAGALVVTLRWKAPPSPSGKVGYDPVIDHFIVYEIGPDEQPTALLETTKTVAFIKKREKNPPSGYAVSAVQRSGVESRMSTIVSLRK